ncbi:MAG TPA: Nramp family divalent metal transporter [Thermoanaerobaculia bacterium]|jgi:manganese transport protein|nr:Nramp family divalent metal transporter [Thermoanaerobaculia bacterium]
MATPHSQPTPPPPIDQSTPSLSEVHRSVAIPEATSFWRRLFAFSGPAYLVAVGYMDPGNWATDIAAGSRFGYALIWVLLMSNLMAVLLQSLSARLGIVSGMDLAQACRAMFPKPVSAALWVLCEIAIAACDLAEVLGTAIGLQLLFGIPLLWAVLITAFDAFVLLLLQARGIRLMEAFIITLILTVGICLGLEVLLARPDLGPLFKGFVPSLPGEGALYLAIGILGATVMPHNLYLHSALVQSRRFQLTPLRIRTGIRYNTLDSIIALNGAFLVNAALLVMAAATFFRSGHHQVTEIQDAHRLLEPLLGAHVAPLAFAIALIAAGQSSTITGTLAGQVVMEGFVHIRLRPVVRRMLTRSLAIVPAVITIVWFGERATGELLVLSQVVLSLQLSFAVIPLVHLVSDRRWMGVHKIGPLLEGAAWLVAVTIAGLNLSLAYDVIGTWLRKAGEGAWLLWLTVVPLALGVLVLLVYVIVQPIMARLRGTLTRPVLDVHGPAAVPVLLPSKPPKRVAAAVDFTAADQAVLSYAAGLLQGRSGEVLLLHVVDSGGARVMGDELRDRETRADEERLSAYAEELRTLGIAATWDLGFGDPATALSTLVNTHGPDLVIVGSHGHRALGDLILGTSIERLRHRVRVPVVVVPVPPPPGT